MRPTSQLFPETGDAHDEITADFFNGIGQTQTSMYPSTRSAPSPSTDIVSDGASLLGTEHPILGDIALGHSRCVPIPTPRLKKCLIVDFRTDRSIPFDSDRLAVQRSGFGWELMHGPFCHFGCSARQVRGAV
jgi:hypothetical protein